VPLPSHVLNSWCEARTPESMEYSVTPRPVPVELMSPYLHAAGGAGG
jgi:hypothetical protein